MNNYIKLPFIVNIAGHCGSGKSYFISYLVKSLKKDFNCITVFSNTAQFTEDYNFLKDLETGDLKTFVFSSLHAEDAIKKIMAIQKANRQKNLKRNVLIIFDDIFGSIKDSKTFKDLISTFRHYNISIAFSAQYITACATYLREISNYIVIFHQRTQNALKICYENYFIADYETFAAFKQNFSKKLQKFYFYFIDRINDTKTVMVCPLK
jgi:ABC-type dipeptide/oligopeptide/nickel transport system ATPase component